MVFPVLMYGCESWTIKKAVCWRIDAFELWCWRRLLRVPWTTRRSNQSILKEINPLEYSLERPMLKLRYFGHLMRRPYSLKRCWCWLRLRAGDKEGGREWGGWVASLTQWIWEWDHKGLSAKDLMLSSCGAGEGSIESPLGSKIKPNSILMKINSEYSWFFQYSCMDVRVGL